MMAGASSMSDGRPGVRVLHLSDVHLGQARFSQPGLPNSRLDDADRMLRDVVVTAREREHPDLAIVAGDLFHGRNPRPAELAVAARFIGDLSSVCPVVVTPGNHDGPSTIGDVASHTLGWLDAIGLPDVWVPLTPGFAVMGGAVVVSIPYPHRRAFDNLMPGATLAERHAALGRAVDDLITALRTRADVIAHGKPVIFAGHLTAAGSLVGSERTMRLEDDVTVGVHVLDLFDYAALGHIHKPQRVGSRGIYPGSPMIVDLGEAAYEKGVVYADVVAGEAPVIRTIPTLERALVTVTLAFVQSTGWAIPEGAIVRLVADLVDRSGMKAVEQAEADLRAAGASFVARDVRVPDARPTPERAIAAATTPLDAVAAYLSSRGLPAEPYLSTARTLMEATGA
jgi:DNA repair protein SbcD/Mre11